MALDDQHNPQLVDEKLAAAVGKVLNFVKIKKGDSSVYFEGKNAKPSNGILKERHLSQTHSITNFITSNFSEEHQTDFKIQLENRAQQLETEGVIDYDTPNTEVDDLVWGFNEFLRHNPTELEKQDLARAYEHELNKQKIEVRGRDIVDGNGTLRGHIDDPKQPTLGVTSFLADPNAYIYQMGGTQTVSTSFPDEIESQPTPKKKTKAESALNNTTSNMAYAAIDPNGQKAKVDLGFLNIDPEEEERYKALKAGEPIVEEKLTAEASEAEAAPTMDTAEFDALVAQYKTKAPVSWWTRRTLGTGKKGKIGDTSVDAKSNGRLLRDYMGDDTKFFAYQVALGHMTKKEAMAQLQPIQPQQVEPKSENQDAETQHAKDDVLDLTPAMRVDQTRQTTDSNLGEIIPESDKSQEQKLADAWEAYAKPEQKAPTAETQQKVAFERSEPKEPNYESLAAYASEHNGEGGADKMKKPLKEGEIITFTRNGKSSSYEVTAVNPMTGEAERVRLLNTPKEGKPSL